jgi:hypothetical protein
LKESKMSPLITRRSALMTDTALAALGPLALTAHAASVGQPAPAFELVDINGKRVTCGGSLRG